MIRRRTVVPFLLFILLSGAIDGRLLGQPSGLNATLVLRSQAVSIAEEAYAALGQSVSASEHVGISVEGGRMRAIVENAFLDLFARKGLEASLQGFQPRTRQVVQVNILDQGVRYSSLSDGQYRRDIRTAIEARRTSNDTSSTAYLGLFQRQQVDTVAFREDAGAAGAASESERTLFDRLLEPMLLIGGTFLIVYLFFTIRN
jgi:hypothetical protein